MKILEEGLNVVGNEHRFGACAQHAQGSSFNMQNKQR